MILTPYSAQVTTIRNLILNERSQLKDVHVGTVVTSQGNPFVIDASVILNRTFENNCSDYAFIELSSGLLLQIN